MVRRRVVSGLLLLLRLGGLHERLQLLIELVGLLLLEYLNVAAVSLVELHQLLIEPILLLFLPLLQLRRIAGRPLLLVFLDAEGPARILTLVGLISVVLPAIGASILLNGLRFVVSMIVLIGCCLIPVEELRVRDNLPPMVDGFAATALAITLLLLVRAALTALLDDASVPTAILRSSGRMLH